MKVNERILILCEGMTEYIYAKSLQRDLPRNQQRGISVEIIYQTQNDPKSLALEAKKKVKIAQRERNPYNTVWLFFDNDNSPNLQEAFFIINKEGFRVAYTSICFEHWFILHFESCGRSFNSGYEALKYLQKLWPQYHKTKSNPYMELKNKLDQAVKRAEMILRNKADNQEIFEMNPYFTVHELISFFEQLKGGNQ
jgi:hypothetical protein